MRIGERVDLLVFLHPALEARAHAAQFFSPDDVGQQIAEAKVNVRLGQKYVRQPIQASSLLWVFGNLA